MPNAKRLLERLTQARSLAQTPARTPPLAEQPPQHMAEEGTSPIPPTRAEDAHPATSAPSADQSRLLTFLGTLPTPDGSSPVRIDTHANSVFLVGETAYKVKRAVKFPFLDYSTLENREEACKREISCNARYAPDLYLEAVPITDEGAAGLAFQGQGPVLDWAVKMKRFDETMTFDHLAEQGELAPALVDDLADMLKRAHDGAPVRDCEAWLQDLGLYLDQNREAFRSFPSLFAPHHADRLVTSQKTWLQRLRDLIRSRGRQGLIRLCHGDTHLRNVALIDGHPVLFDAIEFDDGIATSDVLYDLAFMLMDLWQRGQPKAANRLFNRYLDRTHREADLSGLVALPFYISLRASLRAKIAAASAGMQQDEALRAHEMQQALAYFTLAQRALEPSTPFLVALGGFSGTGKTTLAYGLAPEVGRIPGARVLRSDVVRKTLLGIPETDKAPTDSYTRAFSDEVYGALQHQAATLIAAGHSVILDAVHAQPHERAAAEKIAKEAECAFEGIWLEAPPETLKQRVAQRKGDASDATVRVVEAQLGYDTGDIRWPHVGSDELPEDTRARAQFLLTLEHEL